MSTDVAAPPATAPRQRRRKASPWPLVLIVLGALAGFAAIFVWIDSRVPPFPTYHEGITLGGQIEAATTLEQLQALFDADAPVPPPLPPGFEVRNGQSLAMVVYALRQDRLYTFLGNRDMRTNEQRLLFRLHSAETVFDYHEFRLVRRGKAVKIADMRAASWGVWASDLAAEAARLTRQLPTGQFAALAAAAAEKDAAKVDAIRKTLPPNAAGLYADRLALAAMRDETTAAFLAALEAFRKLHADDLGADLAVMLRAQLDLRRLARAGVALDEPLRRDAIGALNRTEGRIDDTPFFRQLRRMLEQ